MLLLTTYLHTRVVCFAHDAVEAFVRARRTTHDAGQTTAEYALVLLGAAAVALLLLAWATSTNRISALFNFVMDQITGRVS